MSENKGRRVVLAALGAISIVLLYFLVFAEPLSPELSTVPMWKAELKAGPGFGIVDPGTEVLAFSAGDRFGFYTPDGTVISMADAPGGAPVSDSSYISLAPGDPTRMLRRPAGDVIAPFGAESPFYSSGRLFSAEGDGTGVSAFDERGGRLWSYSFPCQVSAFAAGADLVVGGTVDGWLEGVLPDGSTAFSMAPGGSRLAVILGIGVSKSGDWVAAVSGIDRQRLVVLGRGGADYRVASHTYLDTDYREPVKVLIMEDDRHVLYRRPDGIGVWSVDGAVDEVLPVKADTFDVSIDPARDVAYLVARRGPKTEIVAFRLPATLLGRIALPDSSEYVRFSGSSVFIGGRSWIGRFDFVED